VPGAAGPSVTLVVSSGRSNPVEYPVSAAPPTTKSSTIALPVDFGFLTRRSAPPVGSL
jgi:hypothetical protein